MPNSANNGINPTSLFKIGDLILITKDQPLGGLLQVGDLDRINNIYRCHSFSPDCTDGYSYELDSGWRVYAGHIQLFAPKMYNSVNPLHAVAAAHINQYSSSTGQPTVPVTDDNKKAEWKKYCAHEMVEYVGMTERYKFCKKCDYKEEYT